MHSILVSRGILTPSQLDQAKARQALYGDDLLWAILELGFQDEDPLLRALADACGLQPLPSGPLPLPSDEARARLPAASALALRVMPLALERGTLLVASDRTLTPEAVWQLGAITGGPVEVRYALGVRLDQALAHAFGGVLAPRLERALSQLRASPPAAPPATARPSMAPAVPSKRKHRGPYLLAELCADLEALRERESALELYFHFAAQYCDYSVLFAVHEQVARAARARGEGPGLRELSGHSLGLQQEGLLAEATRRAALVVGRIGRGEGDQRLADGLRRTVGLQAFALPCVVAGQVVALLYGDFGAEGLDTEPLAPLGQASEALAATLLRLAGGRVASIAPEPPRPQSRPAIRSVSPAAMPNVSVNASELPRTAPPPRREVGRTEEPLAPPRPASSSRLPEDAGAALAAGAERAPAPASEASPPTLEAERAPSAASIAPPALAAPAPLPVLAAPLPAPTPAPVITPSPVLAAPLPAPTPVPVAAPVPVVPSPMPGPTPAPAPPPTLASLPAPVVPTLPPLPLTSPPPGAATPSPAPAAPLPPPVVPAPIQAVPVLIVAPAPLPVAASAAWGAGAAPEIEDELEVELEDSVELLAEEDAAEATAPAAFRVAVPPAPPTPMAPQAPQAPQAPPASRTEPPQRAADVAPPWSPPYEAPMEPRGFEPPVGLDASRLAAPPPSRARPLPAEPEVWRPDDAWSPPVEPAAAVRPSAGRRLGAGEADVWRPGGAGAVAPPPPSTVTRPGAPLEIEVWQPGMPLPEEPAPVSSATRLPQQAYVVAKPVASAVAQRAREPEQESSIILDVELEHTDLVDRVIAGDVEAETELLRLGAAALPALVAAFPGPLQRELPLEGPLPRASECGPVLRVLARQRKVALASILPFCQDADVQRRRYALALLLELPYLEALEVALAAAADEDGVARRVATHVLQRFAAEAPRAVVDKLVRQAHQAELPATARARVVGVLAQLAQPLSVPQLIPLLADEAPVVAEAARRALGELTGQDFRLDLRRWQGWWQGNVGRHRYEWLIDAVLQDDPSRRAAALRELSSVVGEPISLPHDAPFEVREGLHDNLRAWWLATGAARYVQAEP